MTSFKLYKPKSATALFDFAVFLRLVLQSSQCTFNQLSEYKAELQESNDKSRLIIVSSKISFKRCMTWFQSALGRDHGAVISSWRKSAMLVAVLGTWRLEAFATSLGLLQEERRATFEQVTDTIFLLREV